MHNLTELTWSDLRRHASLRECLVQRYPHLFECSAKPALACTSPDYQVRSGIPGTKRSFSTRLPLGRLAKRGHATPAGEVAHPRIGPRKPQRRPSRRSSVHSPDPSDTTSRPTTRPAANAFAARSTDRTAVGLWTPAAARRGEALLRARNRMGRRHRSHCRLSPHELLEELAALTDADSIRAYLSGGGLPADPPAIAPARPPPQQEMEFVA